MIKVSVLYPNKPGSHFDMAYYTTKHMPLAMKLLANGLHKTEVDAGLQGAAPGQPPAFFGGCQFYFDSIDAFAQGLGTGGGGNRRRTSPATPTLQPIIQFNEVKLSL